MTTKSDKSIEQIDKIFGYVTFGRMIQALRKCDEVSQVQLAKKMKMSRAMLCDIEKGRRKVSLIKAKQFARVMGYSEDVFALHVLEDMAHEAGYKVKITLAAA